MMTSIGTFRTMKQQNESIAMITAYDYPSAKLVESADVDMILVGDSVGMVAMGYDSTVPVTLDDMVLHTKAVKRGAKHVFTVTDLPFMTYHGLISETLTNARRLMQDGGCDAIKMEGAGPICDHIRTLTRAGVPIVAHLGLTPQSAGVLGGYKVQGKGLKDAKQLINDAKSVEDAGAFALVLECVPQQLAQKITTHLTIPVIGIGAGAGTDGQVLVYHDVIGYGVEHVPKFVKQYAQVGETIQQAILDYIQDVKNDAFPSDDHSFNMQEDTLKALNKSRDQS